MRKCIFLFCAVLISGASIAAPQPDINEDGVVNIVDLVAFAAQWLKVCTIFTGCDNSFCCDNSFFGFANFDLNIQVDSKDFQALAQRWLQTGKPQGFLTLEWVSINKTGFSGQMSRYEITNAQYAAFLNALWQQNLIFIDPDYYKVYAITDTQKTQPYIQLYKSTQPNPSPLSLIGFDGSAFYVRNRDGRNMSNHPVTFVSWYGAKAFCDYYGYRLPTKTEWQAAATYDATYIYGCGATINALKANYNDPNLSLDGWGNNPLALSDFPLTTPVDFYLPAGFGLNDMAGNVAEWTATLAASPNIYHACGGSFYSIPEQCLISYTDQLPADTCMWNFGFRVCK